MSIINGRVAAQAVDQQLFWTIAIKQTWRIGARFK
jgi:hypothetical protein